MNLKIIYSFSNNTIALFSGGPKHDRVTSLLAKMLKSNSQTKIIGVISDEYKGNFDEVYADSTMLDSNQFIVTRNHVQSVQNSILMPYRTLTHYKNLLLLKELEKQNLHNNLAKNNVSACITVGNYSLAKNIYSDLAEYHKKQKTLKPITYIFDWSNAFRCVENQQFIDFLFYRLAKKPNNEQNYIFPSMCIGYQGLYSTFQYLQQYKSNNKNDSFLMPNFSYEISQLIKKARNQFRISNGIKQDQYITIFSPGNKQVQIQFSFKILKDSLTKFINQQSIKNIGNNFFHLFILLPNNSNIIDNKIKQFTSNIPQQFKITFIQSNDKYAAMCSADYALLHNGQITVQAAGCQLPSTVISSMSNIRAYFTYLLNGLESPLNISTDCQGYQDLLGSMTAFGDKISTIMQDHFERPKLRYYYMKIYKDHIQQMLRRSGRNPQLRVNQNGLQVAVQHIQQATLKYQMLNNTPLRYGRERRTAFSL